MLSTHGLRVPSPRNERVRRSCFTCACRQARRAKDRASATAASNRGNIFGTDTRVKVLTASPCNLLRVQLGNTDLPEQSPDLTQPEAISLDLLKTLHHVLLEVRTPAPLFEPRAANIDICVALTAQIVVADGEMVCPQCEHVYRIKDSIPNMVRPLVRPLPHSGAIADLAMDHSFLQSTRFVGEEMQDWEDGFEPALRASLCCNDSAFVYGRFTLWKVGLALSLSHFPPPAFSGPFSRLPPLRLSKTRKRAGLVLGGPVLRRPAAEPQNPSTPDPALIVQQGFDRPQRAKTAAGGSRSLSVPSVRLNDCHQSQQGLTARATRAPLSRPSALASWRAHES